MLQFYRLRSNKIHKFKPKISIVSDRGPFLLKTVTTSEELIEALKLRYEVFHREMLGKTREKGIDVDEFDFVCDHLIIVEKKSGRIVGTYRLNSSGQYYSAQEFHLRRILETSGTKLELGRACIHKDFRRGIVIALLWRGIAEYMSAIQSQILFGCATIKTESPRQAALLYTHFLREGRIQEDLWCPPTKAYSMNHLDLWIEKFNRPLTLEEQTEVEDLIPPLCRAYLKAGALLGGEPAYDAAFKCIDFLTILPFENLNKVMWKKYSGSEESITTSAPAASSLMA